MKYSINQVSNDYIQFLFSYEENEFISLVQDILSLLASSGVDTSIYEEMLYSKFFYDKNVKEALTYVLNRNIKEIIKNDYDNNYILIDNVSPIVRIEHPTDKDTIITYSTLIVDNDLKLIIPSLDKIDHLKVIIDHPESIIDLLMLNHNLVTQENVDVAFQDSNVYVNVFGSDKILPNILSTESMFELDEDIVGKRVNDKIRVKNPKMNSRVEYYTISKITEEVPKELTEIDVCLFNYKNIRDLDLFKKIVIDDFSKMVTFGKIISNIYTYIKKYSDIKVSKYARNHFNNLDNASILFTDIKDEEYNTIKNCIINAYLQNKVYNKVKIDTSYLDGHIRMEYDLFTLFKTIDNISFEDFYLSRKDNLCLYTLVKNGGFSHDK